MAVRDADAFGERGFGRNWGLAELVPPTIGDIFQCALNDPRLVKAAAAQADAGAAGFIEHLFRGLRSDDIAVADDGDGFDGFDDFSEPSEIHGATETLFAGAAMDEDGGDADVFEGTGEIGGGEVVVVPTQAHFDRDGNFDGIDHAADKGGGLVQFGHHGGAATDFADLSNGAAH